MKRSTRPSTVTADGSTSDGGCGGGTAAGRGSCSSDDASTTSRRAQCLEVNRSDFERARERVPPSVSRSSANELRQMRWDEVGGMDDAKKLLRQSLLWPLKHAASFARLGVRPPRGILLYGPPGCAKTSLALCGATKQLCLPSTPTARRCTACGLARGRRGSGRPSGRHDLLLRVLVFLDEIDAALPRRSFGGGDGDGGSDHGNAVMRLLTTLLTEIDGLDRGGGRRREEEERWWRLQWNVIVIGSRLVASRARACQCRGEETTLTCV